MKPLDELITQHEYCMTLGFSACGDCGYRDADGVCRMRENALHYLKEYRNKAHKLDIDIAEHHRTFEQLGIEIARYQKAKAEMESISADYVALKQWWAEQQENPPLSWNELKGMEGEPAWVEYNLDSKFDTVRNDSKNWGIIGNIQKVYYDRAYHNWLRMAICTDETLIFAEEGLGKTWQAYRKERK